MMNRILVKVSLPPVGLILLSIASMQCGAAFAKSLFSEVGAAGMVLLRVGFAAIILFVLRHPTWTDQTRQHFKTLAAFGMVLALMNFAFYSAIERIPLGVAATVEFTGPLGLAALQSKRWLDLLWVVLAAVGVLLLAPGGGLTFDGWGIAFALMAACCLAFYIVLSAQVGQAMPGLDGLCWAMVIAAGLLVPVGLASAGSALLHPRLLVLAFGVAILSSTVPYALELTALRSIPIRLFGVLRSLEPMSAAIAGWLVLRETLTVRSMLAIGLISVASAGAARFCDNIKS